MMSLNEMKKHVIEFEKKSGFENTDTDNLIQMLQKELDILKKNKNDKKASCHQLMDMQILLIQLAIRYKTNLDDEWDKHWEKSKKYMK